MNNYIKVMTWNVLTDIWVDMVNYKHEKERNLLFHNRVDEITKMIKRLNPDIIGIQELSKSNYHLLKRYLKKMNNDYIGLKLSTHKSTYWSDQVNHPIVPFELNGNTIFYKKSKFTHLVNKSFRLSEEGNVMSHAILKYRVTNDVIYIFNVHLDTTKMHRNKELRKLHEILIKLKSYDKSIVMGDFNSETEEHDLIVNSYKIGLTKRKTSGLFKKNEHVDHIYYKNMKKRKSKLVTCKNIKECGSDHFPVVAVFEI